MLMPSLGPRVHGDDIHNTLQDRELVPTRQAAPLPAPDESWTAASTL